MFAPDGRTFATGCENGTIQIWETATGTPLGPPMQHDDSVLIVAFDPRGNVLAGCSGDGNLILWNLTTRKPEGEPIRHKRAVHALCYASDGKRLAAGAADGKVNIYDVDSRTPIGHPLLHPGTIMTVSFCEHDRRLVTATLNDTARIWDVDDVDVESLSEESLKATLATWISETPGDSAGLQSAPPVGKTDPLLSFQAAAHDFYRLKQSTSLASPTAEFQQLSAEVKKKRIDAAVSLARNYLQDTSDSAARLTRMRQLETEMLELVPADSIEMRKLQVTIRQLQKAELLRPESVPNSIKSIPVSNLHFEVAEVGFGNCFAIVRPSAAASSFSPEERFLTPDSMHMRIRGSF